MAKVIRTEEIKETLKSALIIIGQLKIPEDIPKLNNPETKILTFLMENPCRIFSRSDIKRKVWKTKKVNPHIIVTYVERINNRIRHTGWGIILNCSGEGYGWFPDRDVVHKNKN